MVLVGGYERIGTKFFIPPFSTFPPHPTSSSSFIIIISHIFSCYHPPLQVPPPTTTTSFSVPSSPTTVYHSNGLSMGASPCHPLLSDAWFDQPARQSPSFHECCPSIPVILVTTIFLPLFLVLFDCCVVLSTSVIVVSWQHQCSSSLCNWPPSSSSGGHWSSHHFHCHHLNHFIFPLLFTI